MVVGSVAQWHRACSLSEKLWVQFMKTRRQKGVPSISLPLLWFAYDPYLIQIMYVGLYIPQVLVKELVSQLVVLDNNAHPFYKPKLFIVSPPCL